MKIGDAFVCNCGLGTCDSKSIYILTKTPRYEEVHGISLRDLSLGIKNYGVFSMADLKQVAITRLEKIVYGIEDEFDTQTR